MELNKKIISFFAAALIFAGFAFGTEIPPLQGHVNDYAHIINKNDEAELEQYLKDLEDTTGIQMAVLTVNHLNGEDIASYSMKVCEKWQLGQKGKDNGALLLVALSERDIRIEVGYGLEDKLTDAKCGLIIRNVMIPYLKNGDYSKGIVKGIQNMGGIASDNAELVSKSVTEEHDSSDSVAALFFIIVWLFFIFIVVSSKTARRRGRYIGGVYIPPVHHVNMNHTNFGGGFSGGSSFGGGGFHGGGGGFGGGGASGHF